VEHPRPVEREAEDRAEAEPDDIARDVVGEHRGEAQCVVRDPQTRERDEHAADAHDDELEALAHDLGALGRAESPVPVADVVRADRERGRDDLRYERAGVDDRGLEHCRAQEVEHSDVDDETHEAHGPEAGELGKQQAQSVPPGCDRMGVVGAV